MERFEGKNAAWLIVGAVIYQCLPFFCFWADPSMLANGWWIALWAVYYALDLIWIPVLVRNRVELYADFFRLCYGFGTEQISLLDIQTIGRSRNGIASCANSLDRIHIVTSKKEFYLSLKENDRFIEEIYRRKGQLENQI